MSVFIIFILWCMIVFFPVVRQFLPQRDESWMQDLSSKKAAVVIFVRDTLEYNNSYYRRLSPPAKRLFIRRLLFLMVRKVVVGYGNLDVKLEMAILALSAQIQITFGFKRFSLPRFKKIIFYPREFYSKYFGQHLKGLTSARGFVTLSWADTVEGFKVENDNLNLSIHEFGHALYLDLISGEMDDNHVRSVFNKDPKRILTYFSKYAEEKPPYLREYAFTNDHEFFAVCLEHFFESPLEFQQNLGEVYRYLCQLLNQDPLNFHKDYSYA